MRVPAFGRGGYGGAAPSKCANTLIGATIFRRPPTVVLLYAGRRDSLLDGNERLNLGLIHKSSRDSKYISAIEEPFDYITAYFFGSNRRRGGVEDCSATHSCSRFAR